jgi:hypothetical protein
VIVRPALGCGEEDGPYRCFFSEIARLLPRHAPAQSLPFRDHLDFGYGIDKVNIGMRSAAREWQPVLLYRSTCPRCRFLSRAVVVASGLAVRRIANDTPEAAAVYARHGVAAGKLALVHRGRIYAGRRVFAATWWVIGACWLGRVPGLGSVIRRGRGEEVGV